MRMSALERDTHTHTHTQIYVCMHIYKGTGSQFEPLDLNPIS